MTPRSGERIDLAAGGYSASVAGVGASLRTLAHDGRDLVVPFPADVVRPLFRGAVLVPWPNRVVDGRYTFGGRAEQLALTEPDRGHALHGLVCWTDFALAERSASAVRLTAEVPAQAGYPHRLRIAVGYALGPDGLDWTVEAVNAGPDPAPYGVSVHPYLVGGPGRVDDWRLGLAARQVLEVEPARLIPTGLAPVAGGAFDFGAAPRIGDRFVDHAFTQVTEGRAEVLAADGHGVRMTWDTAAAPWVQVHTGDRPEPEHDRVGLAVEPMTCPPDAFDSGTDLIVLAPGEHHRFAVRLAAI